jgi:hypothetical protein
MEMVKTLKRVFKVGATRLDDPCPGKPLDEAVRLLSRNYPQFRAFRIWDEDGVVDGGCLVYTLRTPPAKTNG